MRELRETIHLPEGLPMCLQAFVSVKWTLRKYETERASNVVTVQKYNLNYPAVLECIITIQSTLTPATHPQTLMRQCASGAMSVSVQLGTLRTGELRELLEDEDRINDIIRCDGKVSPREVLRCSTNDLDGSRWCLWLPGCRAGSTQCDALGGICLQKKALFFTSVFNLWDNMSSNYKYNNQHQST